MLAPDALARSSRFIIGSMLCVFLLSPSFVRAQTYVSPGKATGYVNDFAGVIPAQQGAAIVSKLAAFERSTGIEIAVATVQSLGGDTIEDYAAHLFKEWGIGNKEKDNGLLILVAPNERQARIEVGYGLEGTVTDLQAGNIVRQIMIPAFKQGDYAGGISAAADAVISIVTGSGDASAYSQPADGSADDASAASHVNWISLFFAVMILLNILARWFGSTKSWWLGGVVGGLVGLVFALIWGFVPVGAISIPGLIILGLIFDYIVSKHPPGSGPGGTSGGAWPFIMFFGGGRGGRGSGGLGGGSFGGFGGGMSGGGGASGRW